MNNAIAVSRWLSGSREHGHLQPYQHYHANRLATIWASGAVAGCGGGM